jgi:Xaa-Pro aminopeptidase
MIQLLQQTLATNNISATIVPSTDAHGSEYVSPYWQTREWLSGFNGSAGTLVVTQHSAGLWTDSRYFLQAEEQLKNRGITLFKEGLPETPSIIEYLCRTLNKGNIVAIDGTLFSVNAVKQMEAQLLAKEIIINTDHDLISEIWHNRPLLPQGDVIYFSKAGLSITKKLAYLHSEMEKLGIDVFVLSALDQIAWLFNIRGNDVEYNPVTVSYSVITKDEVVLFIDNNKIYYKLYKILEQRKIKIMPYNSVFNYLKTLPECIVGLDFNTCNFALYSSISDNCVKKNCVSPILKAKAVKNSTEIAGFRSAMLKDGVALVKFFIWLENKLLTDKVTELSASQMLHNFRAAQEGFVSESFATIAAYAEHGAIVHYEPTKESDKVLQNNGVFLLDSGGQYFDGTTDITRTVSMGKVSKAEKRDFTNVLKGNIALSMAKFPQNTRGTQLDVLARQFLWHNGDNFLHGTGHGVGHFLNVHEGPQSIRMNENPTPLLPGMVISNEPGIYRAGKWGIRCENLILVKKWKKTEAGQFFDFEVLTLFPFDTSLIDKKHLTKEEVHWINTYHSIVYKKLSPLLDSSEQAWLKKKTKAI